MATAPKKGQSARTRTTQGLSSTLQGLTDAARDLATSAKPLLSERELTELSMSTGAALYNPNATLSRDYKVPVPAPVIRKQSPWLWLALLGLGVISAFNAWNAYRLTKLPIIELRMVTPGDQT